MGCAIGSKARIFNNKNLVIDEEITKIRPKPMSLIRYKKAISFYKLNLHPIMEVKPSLEFSNSLIRSDSNFLNY